MKWKLFTLLGLCLLSSCSLFLSKEQEIHRSEDRDYSQHNKLMELQYNKLMGLLDEMEGPPINITPTAENIEPKKIEKFQEFKILNQHFINFLKEKIDKHVSDKDNAFITIAVGLLGNPKLCGMTLSLKGIDIYKYDSWYYYTIIDGVPILLPKYMANSPLFKVEKSFIEIPILVNHRAYWHYYDCDFIVTDSVARQVTRWRHSSIY